MCYKISPVDKKRSSITRPVLELIFSFYQLVETIIYPNLDENLNPFGRCSAIDKILIVPLRFVQCQLGPWEKFQWNHLMLIDGGKNTRLSEVDTFFVMEIIISFPILTFLLQIFQLFVLLLAAELFYLRFVFFYWRLQKELTALFNSSPPLSSDMLECACVTWDNLKHHLDRATFLRFLSLFFFPSYGSIRKIIILFQMGID